MEFLQEPLFQVVHQLENTKHTNYGTKKKIAFMDKVFQKQ